MTYSCSGSISYMKRTKIKQNSLKFSKLKIGCLFKSLYFSKNNNNNTLPYIRIVLIVLLYIVDAKKGCKKKSLKKLSLTADLLKYSTLVTFYGVFALQFYQWFCIKTAHYPSDIYEEIQLYKMTTRCSYLNRQSRHYMTDLVIPQTI